MKSFIACLTAAAAAGSMAAAGPELAQMVMPGAATVAGFNMRSLRTTAAGQALLGKMQKDEKALQELLQATGFDPRRDLDEVLMASAPGASGQISVVLLSGTFDKERILSAARAQKAEVIMYRGVEMIRPNSKQADKGVLAFVNGNLVVAGNEAAVKAALDRRASGSRGGDRGLEARIEELSGRYDVWFFSTTPVESMLSKMPGPKVGVEGKKPGINALEAIQHASGGVKFGATVRLTAEAVTRSAEDATALKNVAQFLAGMAQMNRATPEGREWAEFADALEVTTNGGTVSLRLAVAGDKMERLLEQMSKPKIPAKRAVL